MSTHAPSTVATTFAGPAGDLEALVASPAGTPTGTAVIAHPHPLFGGTMTNKVVHTIARACVHSGWRAVRFNFRGVGASAGRYDEGRGEAEDMLAVVAQAAAADAPLVLAGFSFGAFVTTHVVAALAPQRPLEKIVLVGTGVGNFDARPLAPELHERSLVVHGEADDTVPLAAVMDWARPQDLPVTVIPGGEHFFHGRLPLLKSLVERHIRSCPPLQPT